MYLMTVRRIHYVVFAWELGVPSYESPTIQTNVGGGVQYTSLLVTQTVIDCGSHSGLSGSHQPTTKHSSFCGAHSDWWGTKGTGLFLRDLQSRCYVQCRVCTCTGRKVCCTIGLRWMWLKPDDTIFAAYPSCSTMDGLWSSWSFDYACSSDAWIGRSAWTSIFPVF
jgi:hypothetical protein